MTTKHTKGEWAIDPQSGDTVSGEITVARPHGPAGKHIDVKDEHEANAKLIAAAPEMLEKITYTIPLIKQWISMNKLEGINKKAAEAIVKNFEEVINKITE